MCKYELMSRNRLKLGHLHVTKQHAQLGEVTAVNLAERRQPFSAGPCFPPYMKLQSRNIF